MNKKKEIKVEKNKPIEIFHSARSIHDLYDANYDITDLQIMTVDGVIPFMDISEARLLFFHHIPSILINNQKKEKKLNRCLIELRMQISTLKMISKIINIEIDNLEKHQVNDKKSKLEIKNPNQVMYG